MEIRERDQGFQLSTITYTSRDQPQADACMRASELTRTTDVFGKGLQDCNQ